MPQQHRQAIETVGAIVVSTVVTIIFGAVLVAWIYMPVRPENASILNILVGALVSAFVQVVGFWLGSSWGSKGKDRLIAQLTNQSSSLEIESEKPSDQK